MIIIIAVLLKSFHRTQFILDLSISVVAFPATKILVWKLALLQEKSWLSLDGTILYNLGLVLYILLWLVGCITNKVILHISDLLINLTTLLDISNRLLRITAQPVWPMSWGHLQGQGWNWCYRCEVNGTSSSEYFVSLSFHLYLFNSSVKSFLVFTYKDCSGRCLLNLMWIVSGSDLVLCRDTQPFLRRKLALYCIRIQNQLRRLVHEVLSYPL